MEKQENPTVKATVKSQAEQQTEQQAGIQTAPPAEQQTGMRTKSSAEQRQKTEPRDISRGKHHDDDSINGRLIQNLRDLSHTMRSLYEGRGSQKRILILLDRAGGSMTQRNLTGRLGIQPGSASEVIAKLEHAGYIRRTPNETDRRTADIGLTEEGRRQAVKAAEQRTLRHEQMFSCLSDAEKTELLALLEKINADWEDRYRGIRERRRQDRRRRRERRYCGNATYHEEKPHCGTEE